jgi:threonine dehydratase
VYFKCENFQRIGAFKFRGAFNAISQLSEAQRSCGVVTHSSGNHAQAVALVGQMLKAQTVIVMPSNAPATKRSATEEYGATIVEYDSEKTTREEVAKALQIKHGYTMIPPFDHLDVIAGQGTAALEMFEEIGNLDVLLVPFITPLNRVVGYFNGRKTKIGRLPTYSKAVSTTRRFRARPSLESFGATGSLSP